MYGLRSKQNFLGVICEISFTVIIKILSSFPLCSISILIGAPKANTSQPNITEGGGVFLCPWSQTNCSIIDFDKQGRVSCYLN